MRGTARLRRLGTTRLRAFGTTRLRAFGTTPLALLVALGCAASGVAAGPALDALEGRWTPTDCSDPATGTWSVFGNQIQFFWPTDRANDALENVISESDNVVETEVVSPDRLKGKRFRYTLRGRDEVLILNVFDQKEVLVRRCAG
jgi:hypothetical protein